MQISKLLKLKINDTKEFEVLDYETGKTSQTYNPKTKTMEDTPAFISLYYAGSKHIKKLQLELQRNAIEAIKDKKEIPNEEEIEELFLYELIAGYRGFKDDKGKELEFNKENTKILLESQYLRMLIEEVSSKMGNFSEK